jgi:hypothetical protein
MSLQSLTVIVPDHFLAQEPRNGDDVQAVCPVTRNKVLQRRVAGEVRQGSRWRGSWIG